MKLTDQFKSVLYEWMIMSERLGVNETFCCGLFHICSHQKPSQHLIHFRFKLFIVYFPRIGSGRLKTIKSLKWTEGWTEYLPTANIKLHIITKSALMCPLLLSHLSLSGCLFLSFFFPFLSFFHSFIRFSCMSAVSMAMKASSKPHTCSSSSCLWAPFRLATDDIIASERHKNRFLIGLLWWQLHCRLCLEHTAKLLSCNGYQRHDLAREPVLSLYSLEHYWNQFLCVYICDIYIMARRGQASQKRH